MKPLIQMKPLQLSFLPLSELNTAYQDILQRWERGEPMEREAFGVDREEAQRKICEFVNDLGREAVYVNDLYQVNVRRTEQNIVHLSIKRLDKEACHDWRDFQEIKNQLVGEDCEGIELYPAEERRVDIANQYHLWCSSDPTFRFPVGWTKRYVTGSPGGKAKQRPLTENINE